jgi:hypothetical protein
MKNLIGDMPLAPKSIPLLFFPTQEVQIPAVGEDRKRTSVFFMSDLFLPSQMLQFSVCVKNVHVCCKPGDLFSIPALELP